MTQCNLELLVIVQISYSRHNTPVIIIVILRMVHQLFRVSICTCEPRQERNGGLVSTGTSAACGWQISKEVSVS